MQTKYTFLWAGIVAVALGIGFVTGSAQESSAPRIVAVYGVGGVLRRQALVWL
jgi:hypothetical protein